MHRALQNVVLVAALAVAQTGAAQVAKLYKWVDENGEVSYSQVQPPGTGLQPIEMYVPGPSDDEAEEALRTLSERAESQRKDRQFAASVMAEQAEREQRIRDNCDIAQENRRILTSAPRVQDVDEQGNAYFLEPNAITAKLAQAEDQVRKYCP